MLLHNDPYRLFEDLFFQDQSLTPFEEKEDTYEASLEVPGFSKENLKIEIEEGYLKIKGETEVGGKKKTVSKTYELPQKSDTKKLSATLNNGILGLSLPRKDSLRKLSIKIT
jgi:HSP20 family protein|tara:strand:- start:992 stop:1327 length:336 start_codon:yes stop_codon:yes gene_type:complete